MARSFPFFLLVLLVALASCRTQNLASLAGATDPQMAPALPDSLPEYRIRKDDKLNISVWGQDDLSVGSVYGIYNSNEVYGKWLLVDSRGEISVPRLGIFRVEGMTLPLLKDSLRQRFGKWITNPVVDVKVMNKEITVLGEVRNPGVIQVDKDRNGLMEIVAKTGGFEFYADLRHVKILRQEGPNVRVAEIDLTLKSNETQLNVALRPGDQIIVPSRRNKDFDKRISTIIPFTTVVTAGAILFKTLFP